MGNEKQTGGTVGQCIYCGSLDDLTREHIIPYGLSGTLVLNGSSCKTCASETSKLERRLLRGHWWPYRQFLGLRSRSAGEEIPDLKVVVKRSDGTETEARLPMEKQSVAMILELDPPSILSGTLREDEPNAPRMYMKLLADPPSIVRLNDVDYRLLPDEKLEIPVNFDAGDLCRFLAKVAHGYAIHRRGLNACTEYFLPQFILGKTTGIQSYVGGSSSPFLDKRLPRGGLHAMMDRVNNGFLTVYIQLFRDRGDPPPIYEIVVGRL
jgi:hypothetical protein